MKVLHLLKTSVGASWALRQTAELVRLGVEVHVALPQGPMVEKYAQAGVHVHLFNFALDVKHPWRNGSKCRALRRLVATLKPHIVHSHFVATTLLMRWALRKDQTPRVFHVPGPLHLEHRIFRMLDLQSAHDADYWLASCLWTRNHYRQSGIPKEKVGLAYYGVNEEDFQFTSQSTSIRQREDVAETDFLVGMVAYFYAPKRYLGQRRGLKGHEDLIDAMVIVNERYPHARLVLVGGPWAGADRYYDKVKQYANEQLGHRCIFLGYRKDVPELYPQFDLAVHPSHSENVGGAVESMYARVPTLTTNVGGFPDLVSEGETGLIAPSKNPQQLADKIIYAIENPEHCHQMAISGYQKVSEVMNVKHNAQQVADFYHQILSERKKQ